MLASVDQETHQLLINQLADSSLTIDADPIAGITVISGTKIYRVTAQPSPETLAALPHINNREPVFLIIGIGSGYELIEILKRTDNASHNTLGSALPLYVLEPDPCAFLAALCAHDLCAALNSGRLVIWLGPASLDRYIAYLSGNRQAMFPTLYASSLTLSETAFAQQAIARIKQLTEQTQQRTDRLEHTVADYYAGIDTDTWRGIFTSVDRPLRVLGFTSRFTTFLQHCMRDLLAGFDKLGCTTLMHKETSNITRATKYDFLATVDEFRPDLIINIDHFRDESSFIPRNIPFVNWIQDLLPNITHPTQRQLGSLDFTFVFAPQWLDTLAAIDCYAGHDIRALPIGINPDIYHPIEDCPKTFDLLYVSHLVHPSNTLRPVVDLSIGFDINAEEHKLLADGLISFENLILVYMLMTKVFDGLLIDGLWKYVIEPTVLRSFVRRILDQAGIEPDGPLFEYFCTARRIYDDIAYAIKTRPLIALINHGIDVRIYGNHWETVPGLRTHAYGRAENGAALNVLMNQARICLNNSPGTSLHMRALEILGSGGFMLNRSIHRDLSDIKTYLKPDEEVFFFNNEIDIVRIVKKCLDDDPLREQVARAAHEKALELFGYDRIAHNIVQTISSRLNR